MKRRDMFTGLLVSVPALVALVRGCAAQSGEQRSVAIVVRVQRSDDHIVKVVTEDIRRNGPIREAIVREVS